MFTKLVHMDSLSVEATVRRIANGDLIILCTCGGLMEPAAENRTYIFSSRDNGRSWSKKKQLNVEDGRAHYHTETSVEGDVIKVFISAHNGKFIEWKNYYMESTDNGETWKNNDLNELPEYAFVRSRAELSNGDVIYPYHYYPITGRQEAESLSCDRYVWENDIPYIENGLLRRVAGEKSFVRQAAFFNDIPAMKAKGFPRWFWNENTVVELEDGHLVMLYRIDRSGVLWRSDSFDYGYTWSESVRTNIQNPTNKPQLLKAEDGRIVLLNTPNAATYGLENRFPLEAWVFDNGMKKILKKIRVSDFPGAYSYANGFLEGSDLYIAYEFNRHDIYFTMMNIDKD